MPKFPTRYPRFATSAPSSSVIEPPSDVLAAGYQTAQRPPAQFFNYSLNLLGQWIDYLRAPSLSNWTGVQISTDAVDEPVLIASDGTTAETSLSNTHAAIRHVLVYRTSGTASIYVSGRGLEWTNRTRIPGSLGAIRGLTFTGSLWHLWTATELLWTNPDDGTLDGGLKASSATTWTDSSESGVAGLAHDPGTGTYMLVKTTSAAFKKSTDGKAWSTATPTGSPTGNGLDIAWDGTRYIAVTSTGQIWTTTVIGTAMANTVSIGSNTWKLAASVTEGKAVAYAYNASTTTAYLTTDHGASWTALTIPSAVKHITQLIYSDGLWIASSSSFPYLWTSNDLTNWNQGQIPIGQGDLSLFSANGVASVSGIALFVATDLSLVKAYASPRARDAAAGPASSATSPVPYSDAAYFRTVPITSDAPTDQQFFIYNASLGIYTLTSVGSLTAAQWVAGDVAVRCRTTGALPTHTSSSTQLIATSNGAIPTQDGCTLAVGDPILVANEGGGTSADNDVCMVAQLGDGSHPWILQRLSTITLHTGLAVSVGAGTLNQRSTWYLSTDTATIVRGTTAVTFSGPSGSIVLTGDTEGPASATVTKKIWGHAFQNVVPTDRKVWCWNDSNSEWEPTAFVADGIKSHTTSVDFSAATAPTAKQVMRAVSSTVGEFADNTYIGASNSTTEYHGGAHIDQTDGVETIVGATVLNSKKFEHACDTTSGPYTASLPTGAAIGDYHLIYDPNGTYSANKLTVNVQGGGTVNGVSSVDIEQAWAGRTFKKIGSTAWIAFQ